MAKRKANPDTKKNGKLPTIVVDHEENRRLSVGVSVEELQEIGGKLATLIQRQRMLRQEKSETDRRLNGEIASLQGDIGEYADVLREGQRTAEVPCQVQHDLQSYEVIVVRTDTMEEIDRRPMTEDEKAKAQQTDAFNGEED